MAFKPTWDRWDDPGWTELVCESKHILHEALPVITQAARTPTPSPWTGSRRMALSSSATVTTTAAAVIDEPERPPPKAATTDT